MKKIILVIVMLILCPSLEARALTVSPARIELTADPGTVVADKFLAINEQSEAQTYYLSVENFTSQGEGGTPSFVAEKQGLAAWTETPKEIVIGPDKEINIPFNINVPSNVDHGGYFAAIFLNTNPPSTEADNQVSVGAKVGVLIFIRVGDDIKEDAGVVEFKTTNSRKWFDALPVNFMYRFRNSGADRVKPQGEIRINNWWGAKKININANPQQGNILPQSIRKYDIKWGEDDQGSKSFWNKVKYQFSHFAFGRYEATLVLTYGSANMAASSQVVLWIIPWQLLSLVLGALLILFFGGGFLLKRYNNWVIKQARASLR